MEIFFTRAQNWQVSSLFYETKCKVDELQIIEQLISHCNLRT